MISEEDKDVLVEKVLSILHLCPNVDQYHKCWTWWQHTYCKSLMELLWEINQDQWAKEKVFISPAQKNQSEADAKTIEEMKQIFGNA